MWKNRKIGSVLLTIGIILSTHSHGKASMIDNETNDIYKVWNIEFTQAVTFDNNIKSQITIKDEKGNLLKNEIQLKDDKTIMIHSPKEGYKVGERYTLHIGDKIYSKSLMQLKSPKKFVFKVNKKDDGEEYKYKYIVNDNIKYIVNEIETKGINTEWEAIGLRQSNKPISSLYIKDIENQLKNSKNKFVKITDYERIALGILATGHDPLNIQEYNLIEKIYNNNMDNQGINAKIFGLILLDSKNYKVSSDTLWTREKLIKAIVEECTDDGGWNLFGTKIDPDMTGMALIALAPYTDKAEVKKAIDKAIDKLSKIQMPSGTFVSYNIENCESICQVIMGLCANGIDPLDSKFIKNGNTLIDALMQFKISDGKFAHILKGKPNDKATEQALQALEAYRNLKEKGQGRIYIF